MDRFAFGKTGVEVPVVGQGTWNLERDPERGVEALRAGLALGMTHVDTAEMYGSGEVERIVGRAIARRRDEVFLASKVVPDHATFDGTIRACEASLRRLGTDYLDLYLLHWPSSHPLAETLRAFEELVRQGKVRSWGLSNFDTDELREAVRIAGPGRVACNQVLYHLEERYVEAELLPYCASAGIALVAYSPFGSGSFPKPTSPGGRVLAEIARAHRATPHQVALAFLLRPQAGVRTFTIPKASTSGHVQENAAAAALALTPQELERIDGAFPRRRSNGGLPTL